MLIPEKRLRHNPTQNWILGIHESFRVDVPDFLKEVVGQSRQESGQRFDQTCLGNWYSPLRLSSVNRMALRASPVECVGAPKQSARQHWGPAVKIIEVRY